MRKWTQTIRLTLSEKIKEEVEKNYRLELSAADPANPFTDAFSSDHREVIEKRINEKYDSQLSEAYDECLKKARLLLRLCVPESFFNEKNKMTVELVKTGINSADIGVDDDANRANRKSLPDQLFKGLSA